MIEINLVRERPRVGLTPDLGLFEGQTLKVLVVWLLCMGSIGAVLFLQ
jgi:hypothetical protein